MGHGFLGIPTLLVKILLIVIFEKPSLLTSLCSPLWVKLVNLELGSRASFTYQTMPLNYYMEFHSDSDYCTARIAHHNEGPCLL